jgi:hypothetical protein
MKTFQEAGQTRDLFGKDLDEDLIQEEDERPLEKPSKKEVA